MDATPPPTEGSVYIIGTATTIIELGGLRVLTDPTSCTRGSVPTSAAGWPAAGELNRPWRANG